MLKFLPVGFVGLMIGGLIAANSSTILTHLNWGSSYLVHDFYRRFINPHESESHYVNAGRLSTVLLYCVAAILSLFMTSAQQAFQVLLSIGAGTGLIYIARWFWWRVSAWSEIVAMAMSLLTSLIVPLCLPKADFATVTIIQVGITTAAWILATFLAPQTDRQTLIAFYRQVKVAGPGWNAIRAESGVSPQEVHEENQVGASVLGWISGCALIWSSLFAIGNFLYAVGDPSRLKTAWILTAIFIVSGLVLLHVIRHIWTDPLPSETSTNTPK